MKVERIDTADNDEVKIPYSHLLRCVEIKLISFIEMIGKGVLPMGEWALMFHPLL